MTGQARLTGFWAELKNCAGYNRWTKTEELAHLRGSLEKEAGQVLWDYGPEVTASLKKLTAILKDRFGGSHVADKYRMEARNRRQRAGESLRALHTDLRRLTALAFPNLDHQHRETIACDYFIDALAEPDFALKVRERVPTDLDDALRIALQLEVWSKDADRRKDEVARRDVRKAPDKRVRETGKGAADAVTKKLEELETRIKKLDESLMVRVRVRVTRVRVR